GARRWRLHVVPRGRATVAAEAEPDGPRRRGDGGRGCRAVRRAARRAPAARARARRAAVRDRPRHDAERHGPAAPEHDRGSAPRLRRRREEGGGLRRRVPRRDQNVPKAGVSDQWIVYGSWRANGAVSTSKGSPASGTIWEVPRITPVGGLNGRTR